MTKAERNEIISSIMYAYKCAGYDFSEFETPPKFCCNTCDFYEHCSGRCMLKDEERDTTGRTIDKDGFIHTTPDDICWEYLFDENLCLDDDE